MKPRRLLLKLLGVKGFLLYQKALDITSKNSSALFCSLLENHLLIMILIYLYTSCFVLPVTGVSNSQLIRLCPAQWICISQILNISILTISDTMHYYFVIQITVVISLILNYTWKNEELLQYGEKKLKKKSLLIFIAVWKVFASLLILFLHFFHT